MDFDHGDRKKEGGVRFQRGTGGKDGAYETGKGKDGDKEIGNLRNVFSGLKLNSKFTLVICFFFVLPITVLAGVFFYNMELSVIMENRNYVEYMMERNREHIRKNIDSVNMTTQFFLNDEALLEILQKSARREKMSTEEQLALYHSDIGALERLVGNNTLLYGVRVYAVNDEIQEMIPILYNRSRMQKMAWAGEPDEAGWHYQYQDALFDNNGATQIAALVTKIKDYENGLIGVMETAVTVENMFPPLYEEMEDEWGCFITDEGELYFGDNETEGSEQFARLKMEQGLAKDGIETEYYKQSGEHLMVSSLYVRELQGTLLFVKDISANIRYVYRMRNIFAAVMLVLLVGLAFLINAIVKRLLRQFYVILKSIRMIQKGDMQVRVDSCGNDEMGELGTQINKMLDHIEQLMKENIDREMLAKNAQIRALQNQINAHFIYNVLESVKMMAEIDEEYAISDAITSLGSLLRYSIKWMSGNVRVEEELAYIKNYLALINLRFDYEIYLSLNLPEEVLRQKIPKMSLQPIVENAIYHGIEELAEDTNIYIKGMIKGEDCVIEISDAGKGMSEDTLERLRKRIDGEIEPNGGAGNEIGLKNVQDRIRMSFGAGYGITIDSKEGCYTKVTVRVPVYRGEQEGRS